MTKMSAEAVTLYTDAIRLARMGSQTVGEKSDYYVTIAQLEMLLKRLDLGGTPGEPSAAPVAPAPQTGTTVHTGWLESKAAAPVAPAPALLAKCPNCSAPLTTRDATNFAGVCSRCGHDFNKIGEAAAPVAADAPKEKKCSYGEPHPAHTFGNNPTQLCKGIPRTDCDNSLQHPSGQCALCLAYHPERTTKTSMAAYGAELRQIAQEADLTISTGEPSKRAMRALQQAYAIGKRAAETTQPAEGRYAIDRPCSACSDGDIEMKYHQHSAPFRQPLEGPDAEEPSK